MARSSLAWQNALSVRAERLGGCKGEWRSLFLGLAGKVAPLRKFVSVEKGLITFVQSG